MSYKKRNKDKGKYEDVCAVNTNKEPSLFFSGDAEGLNGRRKVCLVFFFFLVDN